MRRRLMTLAVPIAAAAAYLTVAGTAAAAIKPFSGTVPNGGCTAPQAVPLASASRVEVALAATEETWNVYAEILAPNGQRLANAMADTPSGGTYAVRICSIYQAMDPPNLQYTALMSTGPVGQGALFGP